MNREESKALTRALKIPGMKTSLNRKAAAWKFSSIDKVTRHTKANWVKHKLAQSLHAEILHLPLSLVLALKEQGIKPLAYYAAVCQILKRDDKDHISLLRETKL